MAIQLPNDWTPRAYQRPVLKYLRHGGKRAVCVWHRRSGKDLTALHHTCMAAHQRVGSYWHVYPTAEEAKKAIWEGFTKDGKRIMEQVFPRAIRKSPKEFTPNGEMVVELRCGSVWRLLGSDRIEVVGAGPVGVVFSEYSLAKPKAWNLIRPMLRENGGWALFLYTPRGNNHGKKLFDGAASQSGWFRSFLTVHDTNLTYASNKTGNSISATDMMAEEISEGMDPSLVEQEYECSWEAANVGSVFGDLMVSLEKRGAMGAFEFPKDGVFTSSDLGISDNYSLWAWRIREDGIDYLAHYQKHGKPLSHYFGVIEQWQKEFGFEYVKHWLPHDAKQRSLQTGTTVLAQFIEHFGPGKVALTPTVSIPDGIEAGRWVLQQNTRFHSRCEDGVEALKAYAYAYDEDKKTFSRHPEHNWASHSADGFRYSAVVVRYSDLLTRKPKPKAKPDFTPRPLTLDSLWEDLESAA